MFIPNTQTQDASLLLETTDPNRISVSLNVSAKSNKNTQYDDILLISIYMDKLALTFYLFLK